MDAKATLESVPITTQEWGQHHALLQETILPPWWTAVWEMQVKTERKPAWGLGRWRTLRRQSGWDAGMYVLCTALESQHRFAERWQGIKSRSYRDQWVSLDRVRAPSRKRKRGRPGETWRRTVEKERAEVGLASWAAAAAVAKDRDKWRQLISGPSPTLGEGT